MLWSLYLHSSKISNELVKLSVSRHLKVIFNLSDNISHDRLSILLEPEVGARLSVKLLSKWYKYKDHFGE
jgi:hypothetical protein